MQAVEQRARAPGSGKVGARVHWCGRAYGTRVWMCESVATDLFDMKARKDCLRGGDTCCGSADCIICPCPPASQIGTRSALPCSPTLPTAPPCRLAPPHPNLHCACPALQVRLVLRLLEEHPSLPLVVVADSDTVWLREPWTYFEQRPTAEFFISSDCLSHEVGPCQLAGGKGAKGRGGRG